jgi:hypothetical protein
MYQFETKFFSKMILSTFLISFTLASLNFLNPGPVLVDPSLVKCIQDATIDKIDYRVNVAQIYASLSGKCGQDNCAGILGFVRILQGDNKVYHQDVVF